MRHLSDEQFLARVQHDLNLHDTALATEASVAVLRTLAETLTPEEARGLATHLPPGLRHRIDGGHRGGGGQHAVGQGD